MSKAQAKAAARRVGEHKAMNEMPRKPLASYLVKVGPTEAVKLQVATYALCGEDFARLAAQVDAHLWPLVLEPRVAEPPTDATSGAVGIRTFSSES